MKTNQTSGFESVSKKRPCNVCGGLTRCTFKKDNPDGGAFCHTYSYASLREIISGYDGRQWRCNKPQGATGHTATFGVYTGDTSGYSVDIEKVAARRKKEEDARLAALAAEMPPAEVHSNYARLIDELKLSTQDRQALRDRGFKDSWIDLCGFKSVGKYQFVGEYPENFPGYNASYLSLTVVDDAILCPFPDITGNWIGAQVRMTKAVEGGRYRWLAGTSIKGELPVACWDTLNAGGGTIWAVEGTGIKPALAHLKFAVPTIGASGGLFASSPQSFRQSWEHLSSKYSTNRLVLAIDAGDVVNPDVTRRLYQQFTFFDQLGCDTQVAWWGQVEKKSGDVDEIADLLAVEYLTIAEFKAVLDTYAPIRAEKERVRKEAAANRQLEAIASADPEKPITVEVATPEISNVSRPAQWASWLAVRKYTPDIIQSEEFVKFDAPAPGTILAVRSGLGSGKTHQLQALFAKGGAFQGKGAIALFARNSLVFNFINRIPSFSHLNSDSSLHVKDPNSCLALCTNSLKKFTNPEWFDGKVLIIDEFSSVALHIACSSTHRKDRIEALEIWREAFSRCDSVIILDGNLTDWQVDWAAKQAPKKKVVKLNNTLQRAKAKVEILLGTPTKKGKFDDTKLSPFVAPILASDNKRIVFSDSQKLLEQLDDLLTENGIITLRVDSKTIKKDSPARLFLDDCNTWLVNNLDVDVLLISPSATSGVDIDNTKIQAALDQLSASSFFPHSYGLFRGIISTDDEMQMMARYRDPDCFWHISVPKQSFLRGSDRDYDLSNIQAAGRRLMDFAEQDLSWLRLNKHFLGEVFLGYIEEAQSNYNVMFSLKNRTKESFEKDNLRECLIFALESAGHEVKQSAYFEDIEVEGRLQDSSAAVKKRVSKQIFDAEDIDEKMAEEISASWSATWEDRCKVIKAGYKRMLPGIDETEHWTQDFIEYLKYDEPKTIQGANLLHLFKNPELAEKQQKNVWAKIATERAIFLPDIYSPHLKVKALQFLKFEQFLDQNCSWHKNSPEVLELVKMGGRKRVIASLGFSPRKTKGALDGIDYLRRLLGLVGLKLGGKHQVKLAGMAANSYSLDLSWLSNPTNTAIAEAVARRYTDFDLEWKMPEILEVPVKTIEVEPEPETDVDGVDWRGLSLQVKEAVGGLAVGAVVLAVGQLRVVGGKLSIWTESAIGRIRLELDQVELYFEVLPNGD